MRSSDRASVRCPGVPRRERGTEVRLVSVAAAVTVAGPLQLRMRDGRSGSVPARALVPLRVPGAPQSYPQSSGQRAATPAGPGSAGAQGDKTATVLGKGAWSPRLRRDKCTHRPGGRRQCGLFCEWNGAVWREQGHFLRRAEDS